ncbi:MAG: hypothetical protein IJW19_00480 [Clostridia bacterium]|nr:hypothetical protein [Clostridia bacterium]
MKYDFKRFMFKNIGFFLVAVVSALYIVRGLYTLGESGKTVMQIIGDGAISASVGFIIGHLMRQTGIAYGNEDTEVIKSRSFHSRLLDTVAPYINELDDFCEKENRASYEAIRKRILSRAGVGYEECFYPDGSSRMTVIKIPKGIGKEEKRRLKQKKRAIRRAEGVKITPLTPEALSVDGSKYNDPYDFGRTQGQYLRRRSGADIMNKVLFGLLFGYYAIYLTENTGKEAIIWASLQIGIYLIFGATQMMQAYMFVKTECNARTLRKTDELQRFLNTVGNKKMAVEPQKEATQTADKIN